MVCMLMMLVKYSLNIDQMTRPASVCMDFMDFGGQKGVSVRLLGPCFSTG